MPLLINPPPKLIENCVIGEPLDVDAFKARIIRFSNDGINDQWEAAFLVQTEQWFRQTNNLMQCDNQIIKLRQWYVLQEKEHENIRGVPNRSWRWFSK